MPKIMEKMVSALKAKGEKNPYAIAKGVLQKRGVLDKHDKLTKEGKKKPPKPPKK